MNTMSPSVCISSTMFPSLDALFPACRPCFPHIICYINTMLGLAFTFRYIRVSAECGVDKSKIGCINSFLFCVFFFSDGRSFFTSCHAIRRESLSESFSIQPRISIAETKTKGKQEKTERKEKKKHTLLLFRRNKRQQRNNKAAKGATDP